MDLSIPKVMGILNVTPDSFYAGSRVQTEKEVLTQAEKMITDGADFLDVGGYSSRPGADDISEAEEQARVLPVIRQLTKQFPQATLSVDTFRASVAKAAVAEGAHLINDISGGTLDNNMFSTVAQLKVPYVLMHMRGTPQTMATQNHYQHLIREVSDFFHQQIFKLRQHGVYDIILDPGIGFAKNPSQGFELLHHLEDFKIHSHPLLIGLSRKSLIWKTLAVAPEQALNGTTVLHTVALLKGASILRVHDVKEAKEAVHLLQKLAPKTNYSNT